MIPTPGRKIVGVRATRLDAPRGECYIAFDPVPKIQGALHRTYLDFRRLRERVRWRPEKDAQHLAKRIELGLLPVGTTLADYEAIIIRIICTSTAEVFVYRWGDAVYPTIVAEVERVRWLVMVGLDSVMETAFPPEAPETYLANPRFQRLGILEELGL
jgi:hypothetical protein